MSHAVIIPVHFVKLIYSSVCRLQAGFAGVSLDKTKDKEYHTFDFTTVSGFAQQPQF